MNLAAYNKMHLLWHGLGLFKNWIFYIYVILISILSVFDVLSVQQIVKCWVSEDLTFEIEVAAPEHIFKALVKIRENEIQHLPLQFGFQLLIKFRLLNYACFKFEFVIVEVFHSSIYLWSQLSIFNGFIQLD